MLKMRGNVLERFYDDHHCKKYFFITTYCLLSNQLYNNLFSFLMVKLIYFIELTHFFSSINLKF